MSRTATVVLTVAGGIATGNVYYVQPLLAVMAADLHVDARAMGTVSMAIQIGYALGILVFVPLGDIVARRPLVVTMFGLTALFALAVALAPTFAGVAAALLLVGITTTGAQVLLPFAADLAAPHERGRVLGTVQTGLIMGTVAARAVSGTIGAHVGWRWVFVCAAAIGAVATVVLARVLPKRAPASTLAYRAVLGSLPGFVARFPVLRASMVLGALSFSVFAGLWTVLAFRVRDVGAGPDVVGDIGLVSVLGAIFAARIGALADRRGTFVTGILGWLATLAAFTAFLTIGTSVAGLTVAAAFLAVGTQWTQISNQTRVFALDASARSRINTIYTFACYGVAAFGSLVAAIVYQDAGWTGFCLAAFAQLAVMAGALAWYRTMRVPALRSVPGARSS